MPLILDSPESKITLMKTIELSDEGLDATIEVTAHNEYGEIIPCHVATERALTIHLDKREIVTVMTLGTQPELLTLGWLLNQRLVKSVKDVKSINVTWETDSVSVVTYRQAEGIEEKLKTKTVTTGCGQGAMYGDLMADMRKIKLPAVEIKQSLIYDLLKSLSTHNEIYKQAGAVHGCALCQGTKIMRFVEDVGRHNAVDAIAGYMAIKEIQGADKIFYTTGRLTSEMVIKVAQMGIPILLSRSGTTHMALILARKVGVTLLSRAKGRHFLAYTGAENIELDAIPSKAHARPSR
ncbi:MAG: FdhD protein [Saprospiraceae bacterium]|jgi:FdhD protein